MIRKFFVVGLMACGLSAAHAAEEEIYVGAGLGLYELGENGSTFDTQFAEFIAGVQITEVTSVEVSYQHFAEINEGGQVIKATSSNLSLLGEKSLDDRIGMIGRVFLRLQDRSGTVSENKSDIGFGLGLTYKVGEEKNNTLRFEYRTVNPGGSDDEELLSAGIVHYFQ